MVIYIVLFIIYIIHFVSTYSDTNDDEEIRQRKLDKEREWELIIELWNQKKKCIDHVVMRHDDQIILFTEKIYWSTGNQFYSFFF